ncbi:MAG: hypothetical protein AAGG99_02385, partial [Pseudomonadota bacterium]
MAQRRPRRRYLAVAFLLLATLAAVVSLPYVSGIQTNLSQLDTMSVVAAPRHQLTVSAPIRVAEDIGMSITAGQVGLVADPDKRRSSADRDRAIVDGDGAFVVRGGTTAIFAPIAQAEVSDDFYDDTLADAPITIAIENGKFTALHFKRTTFDFHLPGGKRVTMTGVDAVTSAPSAGRRRMVGKGTWAGEDASFEIEHEPIATAASVQDAAAPTATTTPVATDA